MAYTVALEGGAPWGFRLQGGTDFDEPLTIAKINPNSKASSEGIQVGDYVETINGQSTERLCHNEALQLMRNANKHLQIQLKRSDSTQSIPEIRINGAETSLDLDNKDKHNNLLNGPSLQQNNLNNTSSQRTDFTSPASQRTTDFNPPSTQQTDFHSPVSQRTDFKSPVSQRIADFNTPSTQRTDFKSPSLQRTEFKSSTLPRTDLNSNSIQYNEKKVTHKKDSVRSPTPALKYCDIVNSATAHNIRTSPAHDDEMSGSTSDSQSSIIQVVGPYKGGSAPGGGQEIPSTQIWSPFGANKVRSYKPISFSGQSGRATPTPFSGQSGRTTPTPGGFGGSSSTPQSTVSTSATFAVESKGPRRRKRQINVFEVNPYIEPRSAPSSPQSTQKSILHSPQSTPKSVPHSPQSTPKSVPHSPQSMPKSILQSPPSTPKSLQNSPQTGRPVNIPQRSGKGGVPQYSSSFPGAQKSFPPSPSSQKQRDLDIPSLIQQEMKPDPSPFGQVYGPAAKSVSLQRQLSSPTPTQNKTNTFIRQNSNPSSIEKARFMNRPLTSPTPQQNSITENPSSMTWLERKSVISPPPTQNKSTSPLIKHRTLQSPTPLQKRFGSPLTIRTSNKPQPSPQSKSKGLSMFLNQRHKLQEEDQSETQDEIDDVLEEDEMTPTGDTYIDDRSATPVQSVVDMFNTKQDENTAPVNRSATPVLSIVRNFDKKQDGKALFGSKSDEKFKLDEKPTGLRSRSDEKLKLDDKPAPFVPSSSTIKTSQFQPSSNTNSSPPVGWATPIQMKSIKKVDDKVDIKPSSLTNHTDSMALELASSPSSTWNPSQVSLSLDKELAERKREMMSHKAPEVVTAAPVWSPSGNVETKEYKPIKINTSSLASPDLSRKEPTKILPEESFAWKPPERTTPSFSINTTTTTTSTSFSPQPSNTTTSFSQWNGIGTVSETRPSGLPPTQSATVTLLQKNRERRRTRELEKEKSKENGVHTDANDNYVPPENVRTLRVAEDSIPSNAVLMGTRETVEGDQKHTDSFYMMPQETTITTKTSVKEKPTYDGIGPVDPSTGMPVSFRKNIDEKHQKDWYKQMYTSLHRTRRGSSEKAPEKSSTMSLDRRALNAASPTKGRAWSPPHARYRDQVYKVQPKSIENYEPGNSSIALQENKIPSTPQDATLAIEAPREIEISTSTKKSNLYNPPIEKPGAYSKYTDNGSDLDIKRRERTSSLSNEVPSHDLYKAIQQGADIPISGLRYPIHAKKEHGHVQSNSTPSTPSTHRHAIQSPAMDRKRRDEQAAIRREQLQRLFEEEKKRKFEREQREREARRHTDNYVHIKSPIPTDRFDELNASVDAASLQRPKKKVHTQIHGKAKALYTFNAQNPRELSFRKGDTIYLLKKIDKNWYEGQHHGRVGIFPTNYVEVITSLDEAQQKSFEREGFAVAKYNFNAQTPVELSLSKGDRVQLIRRVDDNWMEGRKYGRQGIFPSSYVEVDREPQTPLMTPLPSLAPTPVPGSPGQFSPGSTISNGPAPTIPSAPLSPLSFDNFDFNQPFNLGMHPSGSGHRALPGSSQTLPRNYQMDYNTEERSPRSDFRDTNPYGAHEYNRPSSSTERYEQRIESRNSNQNMYAPQNMYSSRNGDMMNNSWDAGHVNGRSSPAQRAITSGARDGGGRQEGDKFPIYKALYTYMPQNKDELELWEGDTVRVLEICDDGWYVGTSDRTKNFGTFPGNYVERVW